MKLLKSKKLLNISEQCTKNHAYYVEKCSRPQKCETFRVDEKEEIQFKFDKDIRPEFIKMTLFVKSHLPSIDSNETLIEIIRFKNHTNEKCKIFRSKNSYEVFCKYQHRMQNINTNMLLIKSNSSAPIDVSLCHLDLGVFEEKCGKPERPIRSMLEVFDNSLKFSCKTPLETIGDINYTCKYGR